MIIFSPGPSNISDRVRKALLLPDISHRGSEFSELLTDIRRMILEVCGVGDGYKSIVFCGSGTLAVEGLISSLGGYDKKVLIISNGIYGERAADIARIYGIKTEEVRLPWDKPPDLRQVKDRLKKKEIGAVYIVHHETTTGILNPLKEVALTARENGKMVLVDGISSIAGEDLDIGGWAIDAIAGVANKCIRGVAGASFVVVSKKLLNLIKKCESRTYYSCLSRHLIAEEKAEPLFTPAIQVFYAFREALAELLEEGLQNRINGYKKNSKLLREGLKNLRFRFYLSAPLMSNTLTVIYLPKGYTYTFLQRQCKDKGYVIYAGMGELAKSTFRLGTVGNISDQDIENFLQDLKIILKNKSVNSNGYR